jgi:hypothetical protein
VLLGLCPGEIAALNDDRAGRALDALFADRASMLTALMTKTIKVFAISMGELHNDATTLHMQGEYSSSTGDSPRAPQVRFGHAKERPDLAQLIYLLTVSSDGYVPITYRLCDGNTPEDPTHIATLESCCVLAGTTALLYVADAKLCNRSAMGHIDRNHGRLLCVMPATRAEVGEFRRFIAKHPGVDRGGAAKGEEEGRPRRGVLRNTRALTVGRGLSHLVVPIFDQRDRRRGEAQAFDRGGTGRPRRAVRP